MYSFHPLGCCGLRRTAVEWLIETNLVFWNKSRILETGQSYIPSYTFDYGFVVPTSSLTSSIFIQHVIQQTYLCTRPIFREY